MPTQIDTRIDFKTAQDAGILKLIDHKTKYADFQFYIREGLNEYQYNVCPNVPKSADKGEYMKPLMGTNPKWIGDSVGLDYLDKGDVWLDAGGHLGFFAVRMAKQFPSIKKIYSYEALPHNVTFALENAKINGVDDRVEMIQRCLVPDNQDKVEFYISWDSGKHTTIPVRKRDVIKVPAVNFDEQIKKHGITAIKMDVEGAEYDLIKSVTDWSNIRVAIIEYHFHYKNLSTDKEAKFQEIMKIFNDNFDYVRHIKDVEKGKNFITHFAAIKK